MLERRQGVTALATELGKDCHSQVSAWLNGDSVPGGIYLRAIAEGVPADGKPVGGRRAVTSDWMLCIDGAPKYPEERLILTDFLRFATEEMIRQGSEGMDLPPRIRDALAGHITRDVVRAELRRLARDLMQRAFRIDERQRASEIVQARLRNDRTLDARTIEAIALLGSHAGTMEAIAIPGSEDYFAAREHGDEVGRALRAGFAAGRRRGKAKTAPRGRPGRKARKPK